MRSNGTNRVLAHAVLLGLLTIPASALAQQPTPQGTPAPGPPPVTSQTPVVNPNSTKMTPRQTTTGAPLTSQQLKQERKSRRHKRSTTSHARSSKTHAGTTYTQKKQDQTKPETPPQTQSPQ